MPAVGKPDSWRRDTTPGVLVIIFGVALPGFLALVAGGISVPAFVAVDRAVSEAVRDLTWPGLEPLARSLTWLGSFPAMFALSAAVTVGLLATRRRAEALLFALTMALGTALGALLKDVFGRVRPGLELARIPLPDSYSFPSGHALASFLFFGMIAFLVLGEAKGLPWRISAAVLCLVLAAGVSASRVYLGVHWFGDIVASWLLGAAWVAFTIGLYWWFTRQKVA